MPKSRQTVSGAGKYEAAMLAVIAIAFIIGFYFYPSLPDNVPSHWNAAGHVDGYLPKLWGVFLMPVIAMLFMLLFLSIPRIDPLRSNISKFRADYRKFTIVVMLFLLYLDVLVLSWAAGYRFSIISFLSPAFAILFYYAGLLIERSKRNWFIGIRTPWTMSSNLVWDKTSVVGGRLFKIAGVVALAGLLFPDYAFALLVGTVVIFTAYTFVYSYQEYRKVRR